MPAEAIRLVSPPAGTLPALHTLADETRPVLAPPPERHLDLAVPPGAGDVLAFPVPEDVRGDELIATGSLQRAKRVHPLTPQRCRVTRDASGARSATITLPAALPAAAPGQLALVLTTPPAGTAVETWTSAVDVPAGAEMQFAFALAEAAAVSGASPVTLELVARAQAGSATERLLWSVVLSPADQGAHRWNETTVALTDLAQRRIAFGFRARPAGAGRPVLVPLWADPTIVAPESRPGRRRNLILISLDTLRADRVGAYGAYRPTTPAIDGLARESVVFTDAWAVWPETSGSHMSLFTSRFPSEHGVTSFITAPSPSLELLAERLRRSGYLTRAFTEDGGVWAHAGFARGFSAYGERRSPDFVYRGEAAATFADAARWMEAHAARTFFLFIHTYQVHAPYAPPRDYRTLFLDTLGREPADGAVQALLYDQEVRYTDDQVGAFLGVLTRLGLAERSIVVITSDHGEEFREHGGTGHGRTLHREVLQVPLLVWAPGLLAPARVAPPASLLDVVPTVLDLLGLPPDPAHRGTSLVAAAREAAGGARADGAGAPSEARMHRPIFGEVDRVEREPIRMVSVRRDGRTAILDLATAAVRCYGPDDRREARPGGDCHDLTELISLHRQAAAPVGSQSAGALDPQLVEKMRALGYLE